MEGERKIYEENKEIEENKKLYKKELTRLEDLLCKIEDQNELDEFKNKTKKLKLLENKHQKTVDQEKLKTEKIKLMETMEKLSKQEKLIKNAIEQNAFKTKEIDDKALEDFKIKKEQVLNEIKGLKDKESILNAQLAGVSGDKFTEYEKYRKELVKLEVKRDKNSETLKGISCNETLGELQKFLKEKAVRLRSMEKNSEELSVYLQKIGYDFYNSGICGKVHELMEIKDKKLKLAVFTVLGSKAHFLVTENDEIGESLLNKTKNKLTIVPLNKLEKSSSLKHEECLLNCINYDKKFEIVFSKFIGNFLVFRTNEEARNACQKYKVKCITYDGTIYDPYGTLTGGKNKYLNLNLPNYREMIIKNKNKTKSIKEEIENIKTQLFCEKNMIKLKHFTCLFDRNEISFIEGLIKNINDELFYRNKKKELDFYEKLCSGSMDILNEIEQVQKQFTKYNAVLLNLNNKIDENEEIQNKFKIYNEKLQKDINKLKEVQEEKINIQEKLDLFNRENISSNLIKTDILTELVSCKQEIQYYLKKYKINLDDIPVFIKNKENDLSNFLGNEEVVHDYLTGNCFNMEKLHKKIEFLKAQVAIKPKKIQTDPTCFAFMEKNIIALNDLKQKINMIEEDKKNILNSMNKLSKEGEKEYKNAFLHVNTNFQRMVNYFLKNFKVKIDEETFKIVVEKNGNVYSLKELSGGQRSIIALSLMFSTLTYRPAPFYIFDEIDAALDINFTQNIGEIINKEFKNAQFFVVSLKNNMYDNAKKIYKVYIEDKKSKVKNIK